MRLLRKIAWENDSEGGSRNAEVGRWKKTYRAWRIALKIEDGLWVSGVSKKVTDSRCQKTEDREKDVEVGMRPPARRGHRGLRPGGKAEFFDFGFF
jgi:hypothetical protein